MEDEWAVIVPLTKSIPLAWWTLTMFSLTRAAVGGP
jgi:hypothetical protein